jgi:hypothetical protein
MKNRFTEEQIIGLIKEAEASGKIADLCCKHGISDASKREDDGLLKERLTALAGQKRRYGYRRLHVLLRREGWLLNWKQTYRVYLEAALMLRRRKRKRIVGIERL